MIAIMLNLLLFFGPVAIAVVSFVYASSVHVRGPKQVLGILAGVLCIVWAMTWMFTWLIWSEVH